MEAIDALHNRISINRLQAPAPQGVVLENIQKAALRAADHGRLRPWRFLMIEGQGLDALGNLFVTAKGFEPDSAEAEKLAKKPHRAPMIMVAIAKQIEHPKVPFIEQTISAGAAVQNMLNAAFAQGVGAIWRSGELAFNPAVAEGLGLDANEQIVGFLYLGTPQVTPDIRPDLDTQGYFSRWPA